MDHLNSAARRGLAIPAVAAMLSLFGCAGLGSSGTASEHSYLLEAHVEPAAQARPIPLTLVVSAPRAAPGFDTPRMAYVRQPFALEYFTRNQWADAPAKMINPLLVRALEQRSGFRSVTSAAGQAAGDVRLDVELLMLQQEFTTAPSRLHLRLRAQLVNLANRRVLATQVFETMEAAPKDDPYGGVLAANRALQRLLVQVADFVAIYGSTVRTP